MRYVERVMRKTKMGEEKQQEWEKKRQEKDKKEGWQKTLNEHDRNIMLQQQTQLARPKQRATQEMDWECASQSTACTARTLLTLTSDDEEAVRCKVEADKDVRRLQKKLRDIIKLESCDSLDDLQKAKLDKKPDVQVELDTARSLARLRSN